MIRKVKLNTLCMILTYGVIVLLIVGIISSWEERDKAILLLVLLVLLVGVSMYFYPRSVESTDSKLIIHRQYSDKAFSYEDIASVERCYPSAGGLRLCGSGGFFGYWGYFTDIMIGNYFGYYGDRDQCILIRLKNGRQYVISCEDPEEMIVSISAHLE